MQVNDGATISLDGSMGEGGGQIVRSALSLSLLTGQPFTLSQIRAARPQPGLRAQHLAAVDAAARICHAAVAGCRVGSQQLSFAPQAVTAGTYHFDIGTAGTTSLVLQTVLLPLALAAAPSRLSISGGTHVPWSPCFHYLDWHWRVLLARMGICFDLRLVRAGFYPKGGGEIEAHIPGESRPHALDLMQRGKLVALRGLSAVANLTEGIAERQRQQLLRRLAAIAPPLRPEIALETFPAYSPGTAVVLLAEFERSQAWFSALGAPGKPAERVADEAVDAFELFLHRGGAIDPWLADQLLLPLALARQPAHMHTSNVTRHLLTNAQVIGRFLPVSIEIDGPLGSPARVLVQPH